MKPTRSSARLGHAEIRKLRSSSTDGPPAGLDVSGSEEGLGGAVGVETGKVGVGVFVAAENVGSVVDGTTGCSTDVIEVGAAVGDANTGLGDIDSLTEGLCVSDGGRMGPTLSFVLSSSYQTKK